PAAAAEAASDEHAGSAREAAAWERLPLAAAVAQAPAWVQAPGRARAPVPVRAPVPAQAAVARAPPRAPASVQAPGRAQAVAAEAAPGAVPEWAVAARVPHAPRPPTRPGSGASARRARQNRPALLPDRSYRA